MTEVIEEKEIVSAKNSKFLRRTVTFLILISFFGGFSVSHFKDQRVLKSQKHLLSTLGKIALSEEELVEVAGKLKRNIYWAGPLEGYLYSLDIRDEGSVIVTYLPNEESINLPLNTFRTVATYQAPDAYAKSILVSDNPLITSFKTSDDSLIFFTTSNPNNVFMAFSGKDIQVEIFDSAPRQALSLASLVGQVRVIK